MTAADHPNMDVEHLLDVCEVGVPMIETTCLLPTGVVAVQMATGADDPPVTCSEKKAIDCLLHHALRSCGVWHL
jgi:hypothetical protein